MNSEYILFEDINLPVLTFLEYREISESYHNFLPSDTAKKEEHSDEVFDLLQKSYASQGGIKGNGLNSPEEMVKSIPMWKVSKKDGKVNAVSLYKDNAGRKLVAMGTDGTRSGLRAMSHSLVNDLKLKRCHAEVSGKALHFVKKLNDLQPYIRTYDEAEDFHKSRGDTISRPEEDDVEVKAHPELKDHLYVRKIGGENHTKLMIGTMGNAITETTEPAFTKDEEIENGKKSALKPIIHEYGKWKMDPQIHGPSQAYVRRPDMSSDDWHDFLHRSHEALTNPSKHLSKPAKVTNMSVFVYSKKHQQGVFLRLNPKDRDNLKQGGDTRIETILPRKHSFAKEGTQRIVIEQTEFSLGDNLIIID